MSSNRNVPECVVADHLADIMPALSRAIHQALREYVPAASVATSAAIAGDQATINQIRAKYQIVATVVAPLDGKHYRLKVEAYDSGQLYDYSWRYKLTAARAQHYAEIVNGTLQKGA